MLLGPTTDKDSLFQPFRTRPTGSPGIEGVRQPVPTHHNHSLAPGPNSGVRLSSMRAFCAPGGADPGTESPDCDRFQRALLRRI